MIIKHYDDANLLIFFTAGILLALFGGVRKNSNDQNKVPVRGDIHVIIVGIFETHHALKNGTKPGNLWTENRR